MLRETLCCSSPLEGHSSLFPGMDLGKGSKKKKVNVTMLLFFSQICSYVYNKYVKSMNFFLNNGAEVCRVKSFTASFPLPPPTSGFIFTQICLHQTLLLCLAYLLIY